MIANSIYWSISLILVRYRSRAAFDIIQLNFSRIGVCYIYPGPIHIANFPIPAHVEITITRNTFNYATIIVFTRYVEQENHIYTLEKTRRLIVTRPQCVAVLPQP